MAKIKYDGDIDAVRYTPEGQISLVRAHIRRGSAFSDRILLTRDVLIKRLKSGKRFMVGQRIHNLGGTFKVNSRINLVGKRNAVWITTRKEGDRDNIEGAPLF